MKHILFHANAKNQYKIALLIKEKAFASNNLNKNYISPLISRGLTPDSILALSLKYNDKGKAPVSVIKEHLETILKACRQLSTDTLLVGDSAYFKTLTKLRKAEPHYGYIKPCAIKGYEDIQVILTINYQTLFYNPAIQEKLDMSLDTLMNHVQGTHVDLGTNIIHKANYPSTMLDIRKQLTELLKYPFLSCDIETKSLELAEAGLATISFAWSEHEGCAFAIDRGPSDEVKDFLCDFFELYQGTLVYHGGTYDIKILIYELFMDHSLDIKGIVYGLELMYQKVHDTKLITYLATNTTAGNVLGLKENAFEFAGNYAQEDIKDTTLIPLPQLLEYNLVDCLATWYVFNKNYVQMVEDQQLNIYKEIFIPSMKVITHMELIGMPMNAATIKITSNKLNLIASGNNFILNQSQLIKNWCWRKQRERFIEKNLLLKRKFKPIEEFAKDLNPNSPTQLQDLLYEEFGFDVIDKTDTGLPATGGDTLKKLLNKLIEEHTITDKELE